MWNTLWPSLVRLSEKLEEPGVQDHGYGDAVWGGTKRS